MLFVYASTAIISTLWIIDSAQKGKFSLVRTPLDLPIALFLISQSISTLTSIDKHTSLFGYYSRFHGGLASTICYLILYFAFTSHFIGKIKEVKLTLLSIIASSTIVCAYGILEHFGIDKHIWVQDVQSRVFSTLGQPNWLSAYLITILPLNIYFYQKAQSGFLKYFLLAAALSNLVTILFTKSKSGIGATILTLLIYFSFQTLKNRQYLKLKTTAIILSSFLVITFIIGTPWTSNPAYINKALTLGGPTFPSFEKYLNRIGLTTQVKPIDTTKISQQEVKQLDLEAKGIRVGGSDSMDIRKVVWQGAIKLGLKYPFFGPGVETFGYTYYTVRPASHNLLSEWDFLYNKAHNEYLNFLATTGFIGLGTYLFLIISTLFLLVKTIKHPDSGELSLALLSGYISILITNYYGFSVVNVALLFFLIPAFIFTYSPPKNVFISTVSIHLPFITSAIAITLLLFTLYQTHITWKADINYATGKALMQVNYDYLADAISSLSKAVNSRPNEPVFRSTLAESHAMAAVYINSLLQTPEASAASTQQKLKEQRQLYTNSAIANAQESIKQNPFHTNFYKNKAKIEIMLASTDPIYYEQAIKTFEKIIELSPTEAKMYYNLGLIHYTLGNLEQAKSYYAKALELKPDYFKWEEFMKTLSDRQKELDKAKTNKKGR